MAEEVVVDPDFHSASQTNLTDFEGDIFVPGLSNDDTDQSTLDEPISATLKRDLSAIGKKFFYVLIPRQSSTLLRDWDLWGPLILCILLAAMLEGGGNEGAPQFAQVFVIIWIGATVVTVNSKLLGGTISFFQSVCVLGYCVLPLTISLITCKIILLAKNTSLLFAIRCIVVLLTYIWACLASLAFLGDSQPNKRKPLAVYPICLFYFVISWMVLSHAG